MFLFVRGSDAEAKINEATAAVTRLMRTSRATANEPLIRRSGSISGSAGAWEGQALASGFI